ncbi:uncharacterized protein PGTG_14425 [Puccinia graminis f. sp. tritici CRL 75-36-700-3]|uniref:Uncharacterized protein n=1 Tax=Puccinia graminis f. sp. tritici (strain CRL 75-36-700-3 / race SCCL) TaxID=418459 RepID=E3KVK1_PUCGT|nr:uncharacterized protein PGTG_14425 [Puccinia graminis f. sp. tritici CRL 75-36-700-3]EFP88341.2 hypothetical protein PGTG_14425 [Puccinia graminis f. sp. tritici CRL 75-36-700-3]
MAVSNAEKGQRRRRRREAKEKDSEEVKKITRRKKSKQKQFRKKASSCSTHSGKSSSCAQPIPISNDDDNEINSQRIIPIPDSDKDEIEVANIDNCGAFESNKAQPSLCGSDIGSTHDEIPKHRPHIEDDGDVFEIYEKELEEQNRANDLVQYVEAALHDNTSDEEDLEIEDEPPNKMWSSLFGTALPIESRKKCLLKSGKSSYRQPVAN